jgi:Protein of unknown function (DUF3047)
VRRCQELPGQELFQYVLDDYRRAFGEDKAPKPGGIAVLTDADDTRSTAAGDYANFRACRR